jgi:CheY-like chemotaxis protein
VSHLDVQLDDLVSSTIMLVDDEPTVIGALETFLEGEGYTNLVTATDSGEALALLESSPVDLLLLDLSMPRVEGFEILETIRSSDKLRHTPVIILTSDTSSETKLKALELGATDFLGKPVDPSERGCDEFQGFFYSEPVPPADCAALLADPHPGQPFR